VPPGLHAFVAQCQTALQISLIADFSLRATCDLKAR